MKNKSIVILGGMGPSASSYLYKLLIDFAIKDYGAKDNDDFPEVTLFSIPVPDFISDNKKQYTAFKLLKNKMEEINNMDTLCVCIACNTAHILLPQLQKVSRAPFLSMIEEVVKVVSKENKRKVGLLATSSIIKYGLYQKELLKHGVTAILPTAKESIALERIIRNVLKGEILSNDVSRITIITDSLKKKGAQGIILGCTELPLVFPKRYSLPVYDSVEILAMALLRKYYAHTKYP